MVGQTLSFEYEDILGTEYRWMTEKKIRRFLTVLDIFEQHYTGETLRLARVEDEYGKASFEVLTEHEFTKRLNLRTDKT